MKCLLRNDDETLQGPCLTVKREEWDSSTKRMNRKKGPTEKITEKENYRKGKKHDVHTVQL